MCGKRSEQEAAARSLALNDSNHERFKVLYQMINRRSLLILVAPLFIFPLSGCGPDGRVAVYPTSGTVTFLGEPMSGGGAISFVPLDGQVGKAAGGTIDGDGKFTMSTYDPNDGSMAGRFRVVIFQTTVAETETIGDTDVEGARDTLTEFSVPESKRIPLVYSDVTRSPLTVEVKEQPANELTLELTK